MVRETLLLSNIFKGLDEDRILELPYRTILNALVYINSKNEMESAEILREKAKLGAERK